MGLLDTGLLGRARAMMSSMKSKFQFALSKQGSDLKRVRNELSLAIKRAEEAESQLRESQAENDKLHDKVTEIKKSWDSFQAIANDAHKIQQLITAFKRIKRELLDNRRELDLSINTIDDLKKENSRYKLLLADSTADGKIDVNALIDQISSLKKENSSLKIKCEQQDRLVKSLKDKEEKLVASLKRKT
ncbi:MAG: hypothetical protein HY795_02185 [Desulfovibrio sp.]|nr:hypothetical protein [Desulfovibrio sp.]MBI4961144.1 hypothetical protein [Desulfovibrio sp.]